MKDENLKDKVFTIPNFLSISRCFLLPFFVEYSFSYSKSLSQHEYFILVFICFLVVLSDFLDGLIARYFQEESILGRYLDPVSDKIVTIGGLSTITAFFHFPIWILILYVIREIIGTWFGLFLYFKRGILAKPNIWGKWQVTLVAICVLQYISMPLFGKHFPNLILEFPATFGYLLISVVLIGSILYFITYWNDLFK